jgi:hypothetical protein
METARTLMHNANSNSKFWVETISTSKYLQNLTPTKVIEDIPWKIWFNNQPEYKHLRVFGCVAYAHIPNEKRRKLDMKSRKCIFIGYDNHSKGYKLYDGKNDEEFVSRDVVFIENFNEIRIEKQTTSYIIQNEKSQMSMDFYLSKNEDGGQRMEESY